LEIVLDEWIYDYVRNPSARQSTLLAFLERLVEKCDRFVTVRGGPLDQKMLHMWGHCHQWGQAACLLAQYFIYNIRIDPNKLRLVEAHELLDLPSDLKVVVPSDDLYLVRLATTLGAPILTSDGRLRDKLSHYPSLQVLMVDEFLPTYDC
jgi:hypothetical protein